MPKWTTSSSRWEAREVVVVGVTSKRRNGPPPARVWTRGRWWWWQGLRMSFCPGGKVSNSKRGGWKIRMAKTSHDENWARFFVAHLLPPRFYPPSAPPSLRRPTSLMRGEGHLAGSILVVVGNDDVTRSRSCLVV